MLIGFTFIFLLLFTQILREAIFYVEIAIHVVTFLEYWKYYIYLPIFWLYFKLKEIDPSILDQIFNQFCCNLCLPLSLSIFRTSFVFIIVLCLLSNNISLYMYKGAPQAGQNIDAGRKILLGKWVNYIIFLYAHTPKKCIF